MYVAHRNGRVTSQERGRGPAVAAHTTDILHVEVPGERTPTLRHSVRSFTSLCNTCSGNGSAIVIKPVGWEEPEVGE